MVMSSTWLLTKNNSAHMDHLSSCSSCHGVPHISSTLVPLGRLCEIHGSAITTTVGYSQVEHGLESGTSQGNSYGMDGTQTPLQ